jgi:hypothetical protein
MTLSPVGTRIGFVDGRFVDPSNDLLLIAVLACEKFSERSNGVRDTWLKLVPPTCRVVFVYGRPGVPASLEQDRLYVDCPEAYEMLPRKVHALLQFALANIPFDHLFKTDDDSYLDLERFLGFARRAGDYIGQFREQPLGLRGKTWHFGKCEDKTYEIPYERPFVCPWATGGGYFLSRRAVEIAVAETARSSATSLFEDAMIGEALTNHPEVQVVRSSFADMGVLNPLLPKDMQYVQRVLVEKRRLADELAALRREFSSQYPMEAGSNE